MNKKSSMFSKILASGTIAAFLTFTIPAAFAQTFVTLDSFSGPPTTIHVSGGGFSGGDNISIYLGSASGPAAATTITDGVGNFDVPVIIPLSTPQGALSIIAKDDAGLSESNSYYVVPYSGTITVTGSNNTPGSTVGISGSGYAPGESVNFILDGHNGGRAVADSSGSFANASFTVPQVPVGITYQLHATGASSGADAINYFYVGGFYPSASPSEYFVMPGGSLAFSGSGFAAGEKVNITVNSSPAILSDFTADGSGSFSNAGVFNVPVDLAAGINTFHLTGSLGHNTDLMVTIGSFNGQVSPSAYYLNPGEILNFSGSGFAPNEQIVVTKNNQQVGSFAAGADGNFSNLGNITIPFADAGTVNTYTVTGKISNTSGSVNIGVAGFFASLSPSSYYVTPGQSFTVSGSGFASGENINLSAGPQTQTVTATTSGSFVSNNFTAPFTSGPLTITAIGQSSTASTALTITVGQLYPQVIPSAYYVSPGDTLTFSGGSFAPGETVSAANGQTVLGSAVVDSTGSFSNLNYSVPSNISGTQSFSFTGSNSGSHVSLDITVAALSPYASSDSYYASPGSTVNISAAGFASGEGVTIVVGSNIVAAKATAGGVVTAAPIVIPFGSANPAVVTLTGQSSGATATVPITLAPFSAQVSPSAWYAPPGSNIDFSGSGFAAGENVTISLNNTNIAGTTADTKGNFSTQVTIPFNAKNANFSFSGSTSGATANVPITLAQLNPGIQLSSYYNSGGTPLTVTGMGFGASEKVDVSFSGTVLGTVSSDAAGNFSLEASVPYMAGGNKTVLARGESSGATATANFTLPQSYVSIQLGSYAGAPGASVNFIGSGYAPGETINITTDRTGGTVVHSFTADSSGSFNNSGYTIPQDFIEGNLSLTITGTKSVSPQSIVYYVTGR